MTTPLARAQLPPSLAHLKACDQTHGGEGNAATVYGHHTSVRVCIRLHGTNTWIYDPRWEGPPMTTHTRTHTYISFANPNLFCDQCREWVTRFHDPERCGCQGEFRNDPCGHIGVTSECPSWSPVDGCQCEGHPHRDHAAHAKKLR